MGAGGIRGGVHAAGAAYGKERRRSGKNEDIRTVGKGRQFVAGGNAAVVQRIDEGNSGSVPEHKTRSGGRVIGALTGLGKQRRSFYGRKQRRNILC